MLRRAASALAPRLRLAELGAPSRFGQIDGQIQTPIFPSLHARGFASTGPARKGKDAAERRQRAEEAAAKSVNRFSSPLFSHVELEKDDPERTVPRWANVLFVAAVAGVFGYFARYAYTNETRRAERAARERRDRETRARLAVEAGALRDARRNFASRADDDVDPFEGLSPEEIEKLAGGEGEGAG